MEVNKSSILRKVLAVSLAAAMITGTGFTTAGYYIGTSGVSVSAADLTYGDFKYWVQSDNTIIITEYIGERYIENLIIPGKIDGKTVSKIGYWSLENGYRIGNITIPAGITEILSPFRKCSNLKSVTVSPDNSMYSSENGVLFNKDKTELIFCPPKKQGTFKMPASVTSVDDEAFRNSILTNISFSPALKSIGEYSFGFCENLADITLPDNLTSIGDGAFIGCKSLKNIKLPEKTEFIGDDAFERCTSLAEITVPAGVTSVGNGVFSECSSLKTVKIDAALKSVPHHMFYECKKLTSVNIPNSVKSIGMDAFFRCQSLTEINLPESVTSIDDCAFWDCKSLTSITFPNSVTSINSRIFNECHNMTSINVGSKNKNYSSIDGVLFSKDKSVLVAYPQGRTGTYVIPDSVKEIGAYAFHSSKLTGVTIPDSVTSMGGDCFSNSFLVSIKIPGSIKTLSYSAFNETPYLQEAILEDGVTKIEGYAFRNCYCDVNVVIPASVTLIDEWAFPGSIVAIYGKKGSYAEEYGKEYHSYANISFVSGYSNISRIDNDNIIIGDSVTVNANAVFGEGDYTYAVLYKKKFDTKWTVKQNYSSNDVISVKPAKATDYDICVKVKDSKGTIKKKYFEVKVNDKLKNTSTISATTIKKGETVTLKGSATGGISYYGSYDYAVLYKKKSETKWTVRQGYSYKDEIIVRPYTNTDYDICIKVKDSNGNIAKKFFSVKVL